MVKEKKEYDKMVFKCHVCGHGYCDRKTAQECEDWCREAGTCSAKITKKAVHFPSMPTHLNDIGEK
jgi:hypothetical protein